MSFDLSNIKPRDLLAWRLTQANVARDNKINNPTKENQLLYRDSLIELHKSVAGYFGEQLKD